MEIPRKCSVVVADAEPLARRGLVHLINEQPCLQVRAEAESIAAARELCMLHRPELLVLDPAQGDGFALLKDLPRWSARTRVVVLTALEDGGSVQRAFQMGVYGYLSRRDALSAVVAVLAGALAGERHMGPRAEQVMLGGLMRGSLQMEHDELARLSHRERDIFRRIGTGNPTRMIAKDLHVSVKTVETHRQRIKEKLGCASAPELLRKAVLFGNAANGHA